MQLYWNKLLHRNFLVIMPIWVLCSFFNLSTNVCLYDITHVSSPGKHLICIICANFCYFLTEKVRNLLDLRCMWCFIGLFGVFWYGKYDPTLNFLLNGIWHEYVCSSLKIGPFWGVGSVCGIKKGVAGNLSWGCNFFADFCQHII